MDVRGKIAFLDEKLRADRGVMRASLVWMVVIGFIGVAGGAVFHLFVPDFDGKTISNLFGQVLVVGVSLPKPIQEFNSRRDSLRAVQLLRDSFAEVDPEDVQDMQFLNERFAKVFDKAIG